MNNKYILAILIFGMVITVIGALLKITHNEFFGLSGNSVLIIGMLAEALAGVLFISKLLSSNKTNEFLNK